MGRPGVSRAGQPWRLSESVEFGTISGRKAGALPDANRYKIVVC
jgi:hypothetical protein